ncbi:uncharacterized protein YhfF [Frondihabitans sp. PhB188]|uniref:ASCH domain-containing protein n=1 Tax=Frondihabitans sp. PhB188 TaxID=2485200 RepID=UPI000F49CA58|nr:ASCH domain-containing protein [Frondihabitans sp. PhB188]ROQ41116.1 uncharacterized protein YhfF [Frondihabitans sp. PhB188]
MHHDLPPIEFAFPGPLRDSLLAAIASGDKTSTSSLLLEYEVEGEPVPVAGTRGTAIDSDGLPRFVLETTRVDVVRLGDVTLDHAIAEGEGYASVAQWRAGHERFWTSEPLRAELGSDFTLDDSTMVVLERFHVIEASSMLKS